MRCNPAQTYQSLHTLEHNILYGLYTLNRTITHKINIILYSVRVKTGNQDHKLIRKVFAAKSNRKSSRFRSQINIFLQPEESPPSGSRKECRFTSLSTSTHIYYTSITHLLFTWLKGNVYCLKTTKKFYPKRYWIFMKQNRKLTRFLQGIILIRRVSLNHISVKLNVCQMALHTGAWHIETRSSVVVTPRLDIE